MPRTKRRPVHYVHRPQYGCRHCQSWGSLEKNEQIQMPREIHPDVSLILWRNAYASPSPWWGRAIKPFPVTSSVKQGSVLAPTLLIRFTAMLTDAFLDYDPGICVRYRTDGKLFNLRHLQAKTKVRVDKLRDLLFADDCDLNADTVLKTCSAQWISFRSTSCTNFRFTISTKITEVMYQPAPGKAYQEPTVTMNG